MEGLERSKRLLISIVDSCDAGVGGYYEGEILERSHTVGKADGDKG